MASRSSRNKKKKQKAVLQDSLLLLKEKGNAAFNMVSSNGAWALLIQYNDELFQRMQLFLILSNFEFAMISILSARQHFDDMNCAMTVQGELAQAISFYSQALIAKPDWGIIYRYWFLNSEYLAT